MAIPTTNLQGRYIASAGVTLTSGRVSQWDDQQNSNDMTQPNSGGRPYVITSDGNDAISFGEEYGVTAPHGMFIPSGVTIDARSFTFACVIEAMVSAGGRAASGLTTMSILGTTGFVCNIFAYFDPATHLGQITVFDSASGFLKSTRWFPMHRSILVIRCSGSDVKLWLDEVEDSKGSALASGSVNGGVFGCGYTGASFRGAVYEALFYSTAISDSDRDAIVTQWKSDYGIGTRSRNLIFLGDSITYGVGINDGSIANYPRDLVNARRKKDKIWNFGVDGARLDQIETWWATWDSAVEASMKNIVVINAGINDVTQGASNATITSRMNSLLSAIRASLNTGDEILFLTMIANGTNNSVRVAENTNRTDGDYTEIDQVIDLTGDTDFENTASSYFYSDGVHPSVAGYAAMADYVDPYIVPPPTYRRRRLLIGA